MGRIREVKESMEEVCRDCGDYGGVRCNSCKVVIKNRGQLVSVMPYRQKIMEVRDGLV